IDVFQQSVLRLPKNTGEKRRVDAAAIDQNKHRARKPRNKTANADRPTIAIDAAHRHAGSQAQSFSDRRYAGPTNVFLTDHKNCRGGVRDALLFLADGGDLDVYELLKAKLH